MSASANIDGEQSGAPDPDFAAIFGSLPEPHLILTPDLIMVDGNQARVDVTGVPRSAFLGRHLFDVFPDNPDDPAATGVANLRASLERVLRLRVPDVMAIQKYDIPRPDDRGGGFEERYWLPQNFPVLSEAGEVLWIVHRVEDVTEGVRRKQNAQHDAAGQRSMIAELEATNQAVASENAEKAKAPDALRESETWLRLLLDTAADGVYAVDQSGATILCNAAFMAMLGFEREEDALGQKLHDVIHHTRPDGSCYPRSECFIYITAQTGEPAHVTGESFIRLDGTAFPVEYWSRPIIQDGELKGAVCTFIDVTERQKANARQQLLVQELDHRVKNLFSIVTAIVNLSARSAASVQEMSRDIKGRVMALSAAHGLARPSGTDAHGTTTLENLIERVLAPHVDKVGRIMTSGPSVPLTSAQATGMALVLHELATNAVKYGALSGSTGTIDISWLHASGVLSLEWTELGGPEISGPPATEGFGTILAVKTATSSLDGQIAFDWRSGGLAVRLSMPSVS